MNITNATRHIFETGKKPTSLKPVFYVVHVDTLKSLKSFQLSATIPEWTTKLVEAHTFPTAAAAHTVVSESVKLNSDQYKVVETLL